jgi:branched-chain amino acid transport system substrate-binding protein
MKKTGIVPVTLLAIIMVMTLASCQKSGGSSASTATPAKTPILIGHSVALTGGSALWGLSEKNALDMEIDRINAAGGVLGREIKLIAYDNKAEPAEGVNVANRLVQNKVVAVIGPAQSGVGRASAPVYVEAKIPMIGTTTTNEFLTVPEGATEPLKYIFRTCFIDPYQGYVAAYFALNSLKATRVGILKDVGSDYSTFLAKNFTEMFTKGGGTIVADESFRTEELEYKAQLSKIKDANPQLLFIPTMQKEAGLAMKQAKELGMNNVYFLGGDAWASDELVELGGAATEGGFFVNIASLEDPVIAKWVEDYIKRFGKPPTMPNPVMAVDALLGIVAAIEATGSTDGTKIAEWLSTCKDVKVLSGKLTYDPKTHNPLGKAAVIETIKGGKFVFYQGIASAQ